MNCYCHSKKKYEDCCKPYHEGKKWAETPLILMRSRYSAYALDLGDYIIKTTHPRSYLYEKNRKDWLRHIDHFSKTTKFEDLVIESFDDTHVTFHAILSVDGKDVSFKERSFFEKWDGKWCYVGPI